MSSTLFFAPEKNYDRTISTSKYIQKSQEVRQPTPVKKSQSLEGAFQEFELTGRRPSVLEHLFQALRGIPVSSVEAERCFSTTGTVYILGH